MTHTKNQKCFKALINKDYISYEALMMSLMKYSLFAFQSAPSATAQAFVMHNCAFLFCALKSFQRKRFLFNLSALFLELPLNLSHMLAVIIEEEDRYEI